MTFLHIINSNEFFCGYIVGFAVREFMLFLAEFTTKEKD